ncbi:MAG TPA: dihydrolipoamide acetyltransferase family protein [Candidatus Limnocylindria bacterium]|nr:dihydrolipoamide acetyltransferase family protein [Candidatus Limnocylindria bacterium]
MPKVQMPQLGESVAEGTIGKWLKQPGDKVAKYEPIVEVITDKVNAEVPSPFEGTLTEILVQEGETVPNNTDIAIIEAAGEGAEATGQAADEGGAASAEAPEAVAAAEATADETAGQAGAHGPPGSDERPAAEAARPAAQQEAQPAASTAVAAPDKSGGNGAAGPDGYEGRMTPAVRRLAREHGVDLSLIAGSGHAGRVTRDDVLKFVEQQKQGGAPQQTAAQAPAQQAPAQQAPAGPAAPSPVAEGDSLKQPSPMRKAIAAQMTKALQVPVAYTTIEVDMSGVVRLRESLKRDYQSREGIGLTYDAIVAKATVEALKRHADFNGHYTDEGHWRRKAINLGIAVAVDDGLVVPVIRNADELSIHGLNQKIRDLAERARGGRLKLDDIQGGTFTLDNTGWTGSMITNPIINVPEVGILTMEMIVKRPVVIETPQGDNLGIRPMMYMCLGFDHRATDGAQAGRFVMDVKKWLESVDQQTAVW